MELLNTFPQNALTQRWCFPCAAHQPFFRFFYQFIIHYHCTRIKAFVILLKPFTTTSIDKRIFAASKRPIFIWKQISPYHK
ncbi:hypothetical protein HCUR_00538 [Holospora curviuscula]|uniref:Uncharacterized protein n=1 Tax=Holospora curviuscula TaxID=1082868 RepID=A0A2S5R9M7_9PROT|nr:hypothetical protein HCUR_00538 [Holospora curviuscula]